MTNDEWAPTLRFSHVERRTSRTLRTCAFCAGLIRPGERYVRRVDMTSEDDRPHAVATHEGNGDCLLTEEREP